MHVVLHTRFSSVLLPFAGDWEMDIDNVHFLDQHSQGQVKVSQGTINTFGYYFTKYIHGAMLFPFPAIYKLSANHVEELPYVFGFPLVTDELLSLYEGE